MSRMPASSGSSSATRSGIGGGCSCSIRASASATTSSMRYYQIPAAAGRRTPCRRQASRSRTSRPWSTAISMSIMPARTASSRASRSTSSRPSGRSPTRPTTRSSSGSTFPAADYRPDRGRPRTHSTGIRVVATPGHTVGHQSLVVATARGRRRPCRSGRLHGGRVGRRRRRGRRGSESRRRDREALRLARPDAVCDALDPSARPVRHDDRRPGRASPRCRRATVRPKPGILPEPC